MPNPFGFSVAVSPQRQQQYKNAENPAFAPFGFAPPQSKMQQTADILKPYITGPFDAFQSLMNSPFALGFDPTEQDAANGLAAGGGAMMAGSIVPKPANALNMGIKAFHGSPHSFDKFSMDKIGTGEGAQAYGHGLYFAENEGVAKGYRNALSKWSVDGGVPDATRPDHIAAVTLKGHDGNKADAIADLTITATQGPIEERQLAIDAINLLKGGKPLPKADGGSMYEVNIDADPNAFLDWDKPLSEQPEAVRAALKKLNIDTGSMTAKDRVETIEAAMSGDPRLAHLLGKGGVNITGDTVYRGMSDSLGATDWPVTADSATRAQFRSKGATNASEALKQAGIQGIKYLDAGSRGAGDGTRNYVVFDDKLISIVKKYGIAGASAMLGYNILDGMDPAQAAELKKVEGK